MSNVTISITTKINVEVFGLCYTRREHLIKILLKIVNKIFLINFICRCIECDGGKMNAWQ